MKTLEAIEHYASSINMYVVAWCVGNNHETRSFTTYEDAEDFLFKNVPTAEFASTPTQATASASDRIVKFLIKITRNARVPAFVDRGGYA